MTIHAQPIDFEGAVATRVPASSDRHLVALCKRAISALVEDHRLELLFSDLTDSFMEVVKPARPDMAAFPSVCFSYTSREMRDYVRRLRGMKSDMRASWNNKLLATGRYHQLIKDLAGYEAEMLRLEVEHGLLAAEQASSKANKRSRRVVAEVAGISATTSAGVAAKCKLMKACLDAGYGTDDEFEDLATSIYADGALL